MPMESLSCVRTLIGLGFFFPLMHFSFEDLKTLQNFLPSCSPATPKSLDVFFLFLLCLVHLGKPMLYAVPLKWC